MTKEQCELKIKFANGMQRIVVIPCFILNAILVCFHLANNNNGLAILHFGSLGMCALAFFLNNLVINKATDMLGVCEVLDRRKKITQLKPRK